MYIIPEGISFQNNNKLFNETYKKQITFKVLKKFSFLTNSNFPGIIWFV